MQTSSCPWLVRHLMKIKLASGAIEAAVPVHIKLWQQQQAISLRNDAACVASDL